ncbi:hypothetical protein Hdeb2414_s0002g00063111 [Helianthus debilis subsp. tardiflorus]
MAVAAATRSGRRSSTATPGGDGGDERRRVAASTAATTEALRRTIGASGLQFLDIAVWNLCQVEVLKRNRRNHSRDSQTRSFLLRRKRMELKHFIQEKLEPITDAMKLVTLHGTVRKMSKPNREFLRS